ncbi:hypothetical protein GO988_09655 [Hymenobacter sp. HMF4947]|uniref:DUF11 domain-containing protein n=1 Tax=Hymenobacter ginkgonis TaxID=2682976 RepID=A0A7K1TDV6_9BACT|nr:DUF11 domain-containing protein [Hymenobacter ginkgonis]MVN76587.1 hypothetical protein [Hymenobacter ginkgonis]
MAQQYIGANLVTNGTFGTQPTGTNIAAGTDLNGWYSARSYTGSNVDAAEGQVADQTGTATYRTGSAIRQVPFPGDASNGVTAINTWLLYNGNLGVAGNQTTLNTAFYWNQNITVVTGGNYVFSFYVSNAENPTLSGKALPSIGLRIRKTDNTGIANFGAATIAEEATANNGQDIWTRFQIAIPAENMASYIATAGSNTLRFILYDGSTTAAANGGDLALTAISLRRVNQLPRGQQTAPTVFGRQGAVAIPTLRADDPDPDGSVVGYKITALPPAAQGTLYLNGSAVRTNQSLTTTEAAMLTFDPNTGFSGNALFTYTATDNLGDESLPLNYGIPVNDNACNTQSLFSFGDRTLTENWQNSQTATVDGVVITSTYTPATTATDAMSLLIDDQTGLDPSGAQPGKGLVWTANYGTGSRQSSLKFTFTDANTNAAKLLQNFTMVVGDIDRASALGVSPAVGFVDQVVFSGTDANGNTVTLSAADVALAPTNTLSATNTVTGIGPSGSPSGNIVLAFPVPVRDVTVTYASADAAANPANQAITLLFLSWCGEADLATTLSGPATAAAGQTVYYYATTTNNGPRPTTSAVTTITLPGKPAASTVNVPNGTYDATTGIVTFNPSALAVGAQVVNYVSFVMPTGVTSFTGQAKSSALEVDNTAANNNGSATTANVTTTVGATGASGPVVSCPPTPGKNGTPAPITAAPNAYFLPSASAAANQKTIGISATTLNGAGSTLAPGDLVLIIQMQGAAITSANDDTYGDGVVGPSANGNTATGFTAGRYEYGIVATTSATITPGTAGTLTLRDNLTYAYTQAAATTTQGQQTYQVIRIPQYAALTLGGNIAPPAWNGALGGVLALDVAGPLNFATFSLDASGKGFRGGAGRALGGTAGFTATDYRTANSSNGSKGEGTAGTPQYVATYTASGTVATLVNTGATNTYPGGDAGRGAPGNAGGGGTDGNPAVNDQNSGGGGGANGGRGGRGGNSWASALAVGGEPGAAFPLASSSRLVLGGGGGAGSTNNGTGTDGTGGAYDGLASSGAPGGGLVLVRTGSVLGSGSIIANGFNSDNSVQNDGAGGGGAGGSILLTSQQTSTLGNVKLIANGGTGGTNNPGGAPHGPGGGGGAGIIVTNGAVASTAALPGANGLTINNATPGIAFGAEAGTVGITNTAISNSIAGSAADASCVADLATAITGPSTAAAGTTVNLAVSFSNNGALNGANVTRTVTLPGTVAATTAGITAPGGSVSGSAAAGYTVTYPTLATLAANASNTFTISYVAPTNGSVAATANIGPAAAQPDVYTVNNTSTVTTTVGAYADVTTTITGPASVNPGLATGNFTANFTNNGPVGAANVTQSVTLPVGSSISAAQLASLRSSYGATTAYDATSRVLTFPAALTLASGATNTFSFPITASATPGAATIQSNVNTSTTNQTTIAGNLPDVATFGFAIAPLADVATTITNNGVATVATGGTGTFIAIFTNNGPSVATNVVPSVQLPTGLANVTTTLGGVYDATTGLITYPATASLASGSSVTSTINFTMPSGTVAASSTVNTDTNEGANTANNTATVAINASSNFDVTTRITGPTTAAPGTSVTLSVVTLNAGPGTAPSTTQTVVIPGVFTNLYVSNGGTYSNNGTNTTVTFPAAIGLASGANVNNSITLTMPATALTNITATVAAAGETNSLTNTATATVGTATANAGTVNLYTTISAATAAAPTTPLTGPVAPNTTLQLNITSGNYGPSAATNAVTRVALPAGLAGVVPSNEGTYDATTGIVTFPAASNLAQGATVAYTIQLPAPATGPLVPVASITSATPETVLADNVASTKVDVTLLADVTTAIVGPMAPTAGQNATYAITTTNNGPATATGVVQTVLLPLGLSSVTLTNAAGTAITGGTYNAATGLFTLPTAAVAATQLAGASVLNYVSFATPSATSYPVTAGVATTTPESNSTNNSATVVTTPTPQADISVALSGPTTTLQGNSVTYTVATTNIGASVNPSSTTTVQLPTGLANVQVSGGGSYNTSTGVVTFPASSNQAVGAAGAVNNTITFVAPTATPITVTAQVAVTPAGNDPNLNNNSATLNTDVTPSSTTLVDESTTIVATVGGTAASDTNPAIAGSAVRFVVTSVNNTAGTSATGVIQRVQLPAGLNPADVTYPTGTAGTYDANTGVVTFPTVTSQASTATATYTINVAVAPGGSTALTATAYVSTTSSDSNPTNNAISVTVPVSPRADVTTTIAGPAKVVPGSVATYLVTTRNVGPSAAASVNTTVQLPAGLSNVVVSSGGVYDVNSGLVTFPTVNSLPGYSGTAAANQAAPQLEYTISLLAPSTITSTAGYTLTSTVATATTEPTTNATNTAAITTTAANQPPVASNVVNSLQAPEANTALQLPISPLAATDPDGSVSTFTLTSLPTSGTLFYNSSGTTYTAITAANLLGGGSQLNLTPTQAQTLRYTPAAGFAGNAFFNYLATDNGSPALSSLPALYTIPVGVDTNSQYANTPTKGGNNPYTTGYIIAYVTDTNGAQYNTSGAIYNPTTGALADATVANGLSTVAGSTNAFLAATGPAGNTANTLPAGVSLNPVTGQLFVSDATKLVNVTTATTYTVNITTIDLYGGRTTQPVAFTIGAYPLPVSLTAFTAKAVQNRDALVNWTTASELNSAYFVVERSLDGTSFTKVGQVAAQGNSVTNTTYTFTDAGIGTRTSAPVYYRLQQVDLDGTATYSPVRTVSFTQAAVALSLYPNPAQRTTQLDLSQLPSAATYQVLVLDAVGRQVLSTTLGGGLPQPLDVQALPTGTYQVLVTGTLANGSALRQVLRLTKE